MSAGLSASASHRVWIVNHFASAPHKSGGGGRHYSMARWLGARGWTATVIGSTTVHPTGQQAFSGTRLTRRQVEDGVDCLWIWSNSYVSGSAMRVLGMVVFAVGVLIPGSTRRLGRPDVVIGSTVHLLAAWAGYRLARRHRVPFVFEIRDVWPETLVDLGAMKESSVAARAIKRLSLFLARRAAMVISPLPGVGRYLEENGVPTPFEWIPNGTEVPLVEVGHPAGTAGPGPFTFMYLGSHGRANALDTLLTAFDRACALLPGTDLSFRLVGSGPEKDALRRSAADLAHGDRIRFEDRIPRAAVNARAGEADCLVANLRDRPVYRFGISLNKLYDYFLAARPIILASNAMNDPVSDAGAGTTVAADDADAVAHAMVAMVRASDDERRLMGERGRAFVTEQYSYQALAARLAKALDRVLESSRTSAS
ncbi:glycosyltransferase family 4 protein [Cellulomonas sp. 179-A 9B4 NHS]|uniref:glycosyltransferase family 4 protein n=1 Tax=Cellulomonas sp. 179-A 9B4 NHS TaxID=3142379 RepID=UPI0039A37421